jgi:sugar O-acyltransferase (sialic acid O-acetyltransferase NeuD family)
MLIIGAGGHATELLQCFETLNEEATVAFYDDVTPNAPTTLFGRFPILRTPEEVIAHFSQDNRFVLGLGGTETRFSIAQKFKALGGDLVSVVASSAVIGSFGVVLGAGLNVMQHALISNNTKIGEGTLINAGAGVHHDTVLGRYCVVSPGARVLGRCQLGDFCHIGANATVLPDVCIGAYATVGAGAVVTRNVAPHAVVVGVPARPLV